MVNITLEPDMGIEPGHQWIVVPNNPEGLALADLLIPRGEAPRVYKGEAIHIAHNQAVDQNIVHLIDQLAHVRYQAPDLIQMTLVEVTE